MTVVGHLQGWTRNIGGIARVLVLTSHSVIPAIFLVQQADGTIANMVAGRCWAPAGWTGNVAGIARVLVLALYSVISATFLVQQAGDATAHS